MKYLLLVALAAIASSSVAAQPLPTAITCYQTATNAKDIEAYLSCFADNAVMVDVTREFSGKDAIRTWAVREVIGSGDSFQHLSILESAEGFARTEVKWASWRAHYSYWWAPGGKITRMSLQYAN